MMRTHYAKQVTPQMDGQEVLLAGWVHETRDLGGVNFVILRDKTGLVQVTLKKKESDPALLETAKHLIKETAITVKGKVKASKIAPGGKEIFPTELHVVGKVLKQVPFEVTGKVPADLDVRLDNRFIDLRRLETTAVFRIRSEILRAFREKLLELEFQEINPPTIVGSATEGGTELFPVIYFEKEAFLAQSPQLYKQLAVMGGMDKVFMVAPVFRAEKHNTTQHLNEITQMDIEMGWCDHNDAMKILEEVFMHMVNSVAKNCADELATISSKVAPIKSVPEFKYSDLVDRLNAAGSPIKWGEDFTREQNEKITELVGSEAYVIKDWPTAVRAFYSMPYEEDGSITKSYDLNYRSVEMASGSQRIHIPDLLIKQLKAKGLRPESFESYIDAFRYGAIPHAGWSFGAERLTMVLCGLSNIREAALFPRDRNRLTP